MIKTLAYLVTTKPYHNIKVMVGSIISIAEAAACLVTLGFFQPAFVLAYYFQVLEWEATLIQKAENV